jgi:hypothetical protein
MGILVHGIRKKCPLYFGVETQKESEKQEERQAAGKTSSERELGPTLKMMIISNGLNGVVLIRKPTHLGTRCGMEPGNDDSIWIRQYALRDFVQ